MIRRKEIAFASFGGLLLLIAWVPMDAKASHYVNPDYVIVPFTGTWANASDSDTWPWIHHLAYGGDWSIDYYASAGTSGIYDPAPSNGGSMTGTVVAFQVACANPMYNGGWRYSVDVNNSISGTRGYVTYAHVDPINPADGLFYTWGGPGSPVPDVAELGWTQQFPYSSCYAVSFPSGVHWHLEGYQYTHYSCWEGWGVGTVLNKFSSVYTRIGSNATGIRQAC